MNNPGKLPTCTQTMNAALYSYATLGGLNWNYLYDPLGQRVRKSGAGSTVHYAYDPAGHLLGEYDLTGKLIQETVWLGDQPVATLRYPAGSNRLQSLTGGQNLNLGYDATGNTITRGSPARAAARGRFDHHDSTPTRLSPTRSPRPMSVPRTTKRKTNLLTQ